MAEAPLLPPSPPSPASPLPPLYLLIMAGGLGTRARRGDADPPKQFRWIGGASLLLWGLRELLAAPSVEVAGTVITVPESWRLQVEPELAAAGLPCPWLIAPGGVTRTASTWCAIETLLAAHPSTLRPPADGDLVAVHDAARPFASRHLLARVAAAAAAHDAAVPGVPVTDTVIRLVDRGSARPAVRPPGKPPRVQAPAPAARDAGARPPAAGYLERDALRALQTPQVFRWAPFLAAHRWCHEQDLEYTDDGGLLAARGLPPVVVMGEPENWKVTTDADLERAVELFRSRSPGAVSR
jgi:2-C-methyl-D-erythritol 4-phosphate cytidylyltransferase/2-C-methyl-D-erythritol 2,4-cyclodiphosphate synthase